MATKSPNLLPSSVANTKFRFLVVGRSGVGKSSLISNIFNLSINDIDIAHDRVGRTDIRHGYTFHTNQRLILHDSNGFEAGSQEQWKMVEEFIREKSESSSEDRLHAIWLCIETPRTGSRLFQMGDERLLDLAAEVNIPVISVFTKYDLLVKERLKRTNVENEVHSILPKFLRKPSRRDDSRQKTAEAEARNYLKELISQSQKSFEYVTVSTDSMFPYFQRIDMFRDLFEATQKCLHVNESLMPLAMAQQISARPKVNYCVENGFSKYWRHLGASPYFEGLALVNCLRRIHEDIITVWNLMDPDKLLLGEQFFAQMLDLIQPLAPTTFGPELTPSKSVAENPWYSKVLGTASLPVIAIRFFFTNYQATPQTAQCLAAYIIDLTLILYDLFLGTLQGESQRSLSNKLILDAVRRYKDHKSGPVHGDVRDSTTSKRSKGYIADLIYKWLDTSAFFSETDSDVLSPTDLISQLQVIFHDKFRYQRLLASKDEDAQKLLDLFQWLLDMPEVDSSFKRELIIGTQRLCKNSSFYPTCYSLNGIKVTDEVPINSGGFADIYRGEFQGRRVCLKVIRLYQSTVIKDFMKRFSREAILWSQLRHLNVLPFYGLYWYKNQACLISPWMEKGDVTIYLKTEDNADPVSLVLDLTQGLRYLHKLGIVHGDVKGINTLVDRCGRACLADFGLSSVSDANILAWTTLTSDAATSGGSARWQAPELFKDQPKNYASDIYAWSCVCYEIFSGNIPFHNISNNNAVIFQVMQGVRPERPSDARGLTDSMWALIQDCWAHKPDDRPTIEVVSSRLAREPHVDVRPSESEDMMTPARFRTTMREKPDFSRVSELIQVIRGR